MKQVNTFLFDGYSDWEISYALPELNNSGKYELKTFSPDGKPVISAGGIKVTVDESMSGIKHEEVDMLILPGGKAWDENEFREIIPLVRMLFKEGKYVAAICGATLVLADAGLLNEHAHTSNAHYYLARFSTSYKGHVYYRTQLAVRDRNLVTASGIAPIEFACEIFRAVELMPDSQIEKWYQLFKNGTWVD